MAVSAAAFAPLAGSGPLAADGLPSSRVLLELRAGSPDLPGFQAGLARLVSRHGVAHGVTLGPQARIAAGPVVLSPFASVLVGRVRMAVDAGGYEYLDPGAGIRYRPRWRQASGRSLGIGAGATAGYAVIHGLEVQLEAGYWRVRAPGGAPPLAGVRLGGGIRVDARLLGLLPESAHARPPAPRPAGLDADAPSPSLTTAPASGSGRTE